MEGSYFTCHFHQEVNDSLVESYLKALAQEMEEPSTVPNLNHSHNYSLDATMLRDTSLTKASLQAVIITVKREVAAAEQKGEGYSFRCLK